jgi:polysaccharide export outer membrane protein
MSVTNSANSATNSAAGLSVAGLNPEMLAAMMDSLDDRQKLGAGDRLVYRVLEDKDLPKPLIVGDAGDLDVPYFGLVPAANKTCRQLAKEVRSVLENQLYRQATVIIAVELVNKKRVLGKVYVAGQVRVTGQLEIPDDEEFTVSKAIMKSGGFSDFADRKKVRVVRTQGKSEKQTLIINVSDIWEKGKTETDLKLAPDDLIFVPARLVNF